jgi:acetyl esterase
MPDHPSRLETALFRTVMRLPDPVVRQLAGKPVMLDGQVLDPETQWMLRLERLAREPAAETLPIAQGRRAIRRQAALAGGRQPIGETRDLDVPTPAGPIRARLYVPTSRGSSEVGPLLVFLHGGGMIYGDLDTHDAPCRLLAERADARVLALDYRLAPEHRYPAAVEDCWAGFQWAVEHADGFYLTTAFMDLALSSYLAPTDDRADPLISVQSTEKIPAGLAPALVVTAGFDPLRDEGELYARTLAEAGVPVELRRYSGLIHGFFNVVGVGRTNRAAVAEVAAKLKAGLHA